MKNKDLISIVVPCYNIEKYIDKCINSILAQSYHKIEIILVNDGSSDNTLSILKKYKRIDRRIRIINKKNGGLSEARNVGIKAAKGIYICFIDGDDYIDRNYVKKLYQTITANNSDIAVCDYWIDNNDNIVPNNKVKKSKSFSEIESLRDFMSYEQTLEVMAWNKLYRTELFTKNNIYYPNGKINEDNFTTYKLFYKSRKTTLIDDRLYYYTKRSTSIMGQKFSTRRLDIIDSLKELKIFLIEHGIYDTLSENYYAYEAIVQINLINEMAKANYRNSQVINTVTEKIKQNKKYYYNNRKLNIKFKLAIFIIVNATIAYMRLYGAIK